MSEIDPRLNCPVCGGSGADYDYEGGSSECGACLGTGLVTGAKALSTSTSSVSEAATKPSSTLEENIRQALLETVQFTHTSGNNIEIQPDQATQALLSLYQKELVTGDTSDGYHTFNELYEFRLLYNAALFNEWAAEGKWSVYKSRLHSDGEVPFGGGWFVVGAQLPTGQITNHYEDKDWDLFQVPELPKGAVWDGHTAADVTKRLRGMIEQTRFEEVKATKPDLTGEQP